MQTASPRALREDGQARPDEGVRLHQHHAGAELDKIVINMGVGEGAQDGKKVDAAVERSRGIAGQKPVVTRAKKSIATFKLREHLPIGCKVTLRRERMYEFLDRLINIALPRVRDFRGGRNRGFGNHIQQTPCRIER